METAGKTGWSKSTSSKTCCEDVQSRIQKKAREIWEKRGRVQGKDLEIWLEAEKLVRSGKA